MLAGGVLYGRVMQGIMKAMYAGIKERLYRHKAAYKMKPHFSDRHNYCQACRLLKGHGQPQPPSGT
eukprot:1154939-Pelagomonas_calceolata.AAC.2